MKEITVLAVDGGGTGCRAALCNQSGQVLGYAQGGSCNYHSLGAEQATQTLTLLFTHLGKSQGLRVNCVVLGLAGLNTKKDHATLTLIVQQALIAARITADNIYLCNDAMLTLKGSVGQNNGLLIVAGTGSIACGITKDGLEVRVGGWGYRVGDEGSGYAIGKAAITHTLKSCDGREKSSGIAVALFNELSCADEDDLVNWVYSPQFSISKMAALAPLIVKLAEEGDVQSANIIQLACQELGDMALTVIRKLDLANKRFSLVLSGGILKNPIIHHQLIALLTCTYGELEIVPSHPPLCAGLRYGLMMEGINNNSLLDGLAKQLDSFCLLPKV